MSNSDFQLLDFKAYEALQIRLGGLGHAGTPIYVVDTMGRVRWSNDAFGAMTGNLRRDIVGRLSLLFYRADFAPLFLRRRVAALLRQYVDRKFPSFCARRPGRGTSACTYRPSRTGTGMFWVGSHCFVRRPPALPRITVGPRVSWFHPSISPPRKRPSRLPPQRRLSES